jgi:hypothetical protein
LQTHAYASPTLRKFCDDAEFLIGFEGIQHLYDVLMSKSPQDLNFLSQAHYVLLTFAVLQDELHGYCLACALSSALVDL